MVNKKLVKYIEQYLRQGYSRQAITNTLLDEGFDLNSINAAFEKAYPTKFLHPFRETEVKHHEIPKRKIEVVLLSLFIIILIAGLITYFTVREKGEAPEQAEFAVTTTTTVTTTTETLLPPPVFAGGEFFGTQLKPSTSVTGAVTAGTMSLKELKLCNSVSADFECGENTEGEFKLGEQVFVYFVPVFKATKQGGLYKMGFTQDREVLDPNLNIISYSTQENALDVEREAPDDGYYSLAAYNQIQTSTQDTAGEYTVTITIKDKFSEQEITRTIRYKLK